MDDVHPPPYSKADLQRQLTEPDQRQLGIEVLSAARSALVQIARDPRNAKRTADEIAALAITCEDLKTRFVNVIHHVDKAGLDGPLRTEIRQLSGVGTRIALPFSIF